MCAPNGSLPSLRHALVSSYYFQREGQVQAACMFQLFVDHQPTRRKFLCSTHRELEYQIKLALNSGTRQVVAVRIEIPFDPLVFAGGLQQAGVFVREYRGHSVYTIGAYGALSPLLGQRWHIRGLNRNDFCYVNLETVLFHLHHRKYLEEVDLGSGEATNEPTGSTLVFKFVRMDGTKAQWDSILSIA